MRRVKIEDFIMVPLLVGAVVGMIWFAFSQRPHTPIEWQRQDETFYGTTYTLNLANDGCYWRIYMRQGGTSRAAMRKDVIPNGAGGKENCPYAK